MKILTMSAAVFVLTTQLYAEVVTTKFPNGMLKSTRSYKDGTLNKIGKGVLNGPEKVYYINGKLAFETYYKDGKRDGVLRWYEESNGAIIKETHYKAGMQHGMEKRFFADGTLEHEVRFVDDKREGFQKDYYSTGQLAEVVKFVHGKREGVRKRFRDDGTLESEVFYRHNFKEGNEKFYDKAGKLIKKERNKLDRPIDVMKKVQTKKPDVTLETFKFLNFNPKDHKMQ